ncbi:MAG: hypothetical protein LKJ69_12390 [Lactobacillus sp.]|jgi:hypothetical protein|nr:hypothetical protein [Lactobacillus sp.]MCI2034164.1 hypothetical protein [Lactobacillus sp.]
MGLFKRHADPTPADSGEYDFAKMVRDAREKDPSRFRKLQAAFKKRQPTPHKTNKQHKTS